MQCHELNSAHRKGNKCETNNCQNCNSHKMSFSFSRISLINSIHKIGFAVGENQTEQIKTQTLFNWLLSQLGCLNSELCHFRF